jgi:hypothetical protein
MKPALYRLVQNIRMFLLGHLTLVAIAVLGSSL